MEQTTGNRVVILGGSFAGLYCAQVLHDTARKSAIPKPKITVLDRNNFVLFATFLPEVLSNQVNPLTVVPAIRRVTGQRDIDFRQTEIQGVDFDKKLVHTETGDFEYDTLVIALGGATNFYGNQNAERYSFPFKTLADGLRLRNHVIDCLERANQSKNAADRRRLLTFVQAGAGCSGLELMTELEAFLHHVCGRVYRNINYYRDVRLILAEGLPRVLASLPELASQAGLAKLAKKGIEVSLNTFVTDVGPGWVELGKGERIETETLIWAAGVKANPMTAQFPFEKDRIGRIKVDEYNRVLGQENVYAIGDVAHFIGEDGVPLAQTAQVAVQQGPALARNLIASWEGKLMRPFRFHYRGDLVSIGNLDAVCTPFGWNVFGLSGWLLFKWVYFSKMPVMQNRFRLLSDWILYFLQGPIVSRLDEFGSERTVIGKPKEPNA